MIAKIKMSDICGRVAAPPSKSMAHRLLIAAGLACGRSRVSGIAMSEDIKATVDCLTALGAEVKLDGDVAVIDGADVFSRAPSALECRESGSTLRFFIPICMLSPKEAVLSGSDRLMERPLDVYRDIAGLDGIKFRHDNSKRLHIKGRLTGGKYRVPGNISSQFITGLCFALPLLECDSHIVITPPIESNSYIDLTLAALAEFGISLTRVGDNIINFRGRQKYAPRDITVEGDYSNAAFFDAFRHMGKDVETVGLSPTSLQGDRVYCELFSRLDEASPVIDISDCPDLGPILFALAAYKHGAHFTGTARLRIKESDRAAAMAEELRKLGVSVTLGENSVTVGSGGIKKPVIPLSGHNDHRIVMSLSVLLTEVGGVIEGAEAVRKSFPDFFDKLQDIGGKVDFS